MNNNQYSQILKLVQLENDINQINNKQIRLTMQHQVITKKKEKILNSLKSQGLDLQTIQVYYDKIKDTMIK